MPNNYNSKPSRRTNSIGQIDVAFEAWQSFPAYLPHDFDIFCENLIFAFHMEFKINRNYRASQTPKDMTAIIIIKVCPSAN
ncbi:MAG: hypothetical protein LBS09_08065 [Bacteroidales bacterium]|jgi:hypothetical protein|nr:hypothetical protein [Bacteroidales bacterium]